MKAVSFLFFSALPKKQKGRLKLKNNFEINLTFLQHFLEFKNRILKTIFDKIAKSFSNTRSLSLAGGTGVPPTKKILPFSPPSGGLGGFLFV